MKRFNFLLTALIAFFLVFGLMQAPLFALADVANDTVFVTEGKNEVIFFGTVQFTATDSTNNITTKAISGDGYLDWENAHLRVWGNAASGIDINVFILGGATLDLTYMSSTYTQTAFDDEGTATPSAWYAFKDTINDGPAIVWWSDPCYLERFKVLKFDGQAGNPQTADISWYLVVPKKEGAPTRNAYGIFSTN